MTLEQLKEAAKKCNVVLVQRNEQSGTRMGPRSGSISRVGLCPGPYKYQKWAEGEATQESAPDDLKRLA